MLEILRTVPSKPKGSIVFAHGICHGAWCWHHYMDFFSSVGYACYAVSYRGHGGSSGKCGGLSKNMEDVRKAVEMARMETGYKPILVGHSMGGAVAQKYAGAYEDTLSALVLLASATAPKMNIRDTQKSTREKENMKIASDIALGKKDKLKPDQIARAAFFTGSKDGIEEADMNLCIEKLQKESRLCILGLHHTYTKRYKLSFPVLVIGSDTDAYFPEPSLSATKGIYEDAGTEVSYELLHGICHDMMLDRRWKESAIKIRDFIEKEVSSTQ